MSSYLAIRMEETPRYENAPTTAPYRLSTIWHYVPLIGGRVAAEPALDNRGNELRGNLSPTASIITGITAAGSVTVRPYLSVLGPFLDLAGWVGTATEGDGTNELETITPSGTVSGGTYDLTLTSSTGTLTLTGIAYNATAAEVQRLIDQRILMGGTGFTLGDIVVGGGPLPTTPMTITYGGTHAATNVDTGVVDDTDLTGSTPAYTLATTNAGSVGTTLLPDGRGIPADVYRWEFVKRTGSTPKSAEAVAAYDEHDLYDIGQGFAVATLGMGADQQLTASLTGLVARPGVDPSLTPAYDHPDVHPFIDRDLIVTWRSGAGNIASFSWSIANPITARPNRAVRSYYPGLLSYDEGVVTVTGSVEMDEYDGDDRLDWLTADTFPVEAHWQSRSTVGATDAPYEMWFEAPALQITGGTGPQDLSNRRRFGATYDWTASFSPDDGYDVKLTLVSGLASHEAYA